VATKRTPCIMHHWAATELLLLLAAPTPHADLSVAQRTECIRMV
jgi:hypothetical protein